MFSSLLYHDIVYLVSWVTIWGFPDVKTVNVLLKVLVDKKIILNTKIEEHFPPYIYLTNAKYVRRYYILLRMVDFGIEVPITQRIHGILLIAKLSF